MSCAPFVIYVYIFYIFSHPRTASHRLPSSSLSLSLSLSHFTSLHLLSSSPPTLVIFSNPSSTRSNYPICFLSHPHTMAQFYQYGQVEPSRCSAMGPPPPPREPTVYQYIPAQMQQSLHTGPLPPSNPMPPMAPPLAPQPGSQTVQVGMTQQIVTNIPLVLDASPSLFMCLSLCVCFRFLSPFVLFLLFFLSANVALIDIRLVTASLASNSSARRPPTSLLHLPVSLRSPTMAQSPSREQRVLRSTRRTLRSHEPLALLGLKA